jgi:hypothetical protein
MVCVEEFVGTVHSFDSFFDWVTEDLPRGEGIKRSNGNSSVWLLQPMMIFCDDTRRSVKVVSAGSNKGVEIEETKECRQKMIVTTQTEFRN